MSNLKLLNGFTYDSIIKDNNITTHIAIANNNNDILRHMYYVLEAKCENFGDIFDEKFRFNRSLLNTSIFINGLCLTTNTNKLVDYYLNTYPKLKDYNINIEYDKVGEEFIIRWREPILHYLMEYETNFNHTFKFINSITIKNEMENDVKFKLIKCGVNMKISREDKNDLLKIINVNIPIYYKVKINQMINLIRKPKKIMLKLYKNNEVVDIENLSMTYDNVNCLFSSFNKYDLNEMKLPDKTLVLDDKYFWDTKGTTILFDTKVNDNIDIYHFKVIIVNSNNIYFSEKNIKLEC